MADDILALMDALGDRARARRRPCRRAASRPGAGADGARAARQAGGRQRLGARPTRISRAASTARLALLRDSGPEAYLRAQPIFLYPADWIASTTPRSRPRLPHQLAAFPGRATMEKRIAALARVRHRATGSARSPCPCWRSPREDDMLVPCTASEALRGRRPAAAHRSDGLGRPRLQRHRSRTLSTCHLSLRAFLRS